MIDLTPFGFTPTESVAYNKLLERGPSTGYALARAIGIARANAYQSLHGLVSKGGAAASGGTPPLFRAVRPDAILALAIGRASERLDALESQVRSVETEGTADRSIELSGDRAVLDVATRLIVREEGHLRGVAQPAFLADTAPAWRKRSSGGGQVALFVPGDQPVHAAVSVSGRLSQESIDRRVPGLIVILVAEQQILVARRLGTAVSGYWSSDPLQVMMASALIEAMTTNH